MPRGVGISARGVYGRLPFVGCGDTCTICRNFDPSVRWHYYVEKGKMYATEERYFGELKKTTHMCSRI